MRAAAKLGGKISDLDDAHALAIFFAEQRHGFVFVDGDIERNIFDDLDLRILQHFFIGQVFNVLQFLVGHVGKVGKIEAQMLRID